MKFAEKEQTAISAAMPDVELFWEIVFGRGVRPEPDLFGDSRNIEAQDVEGLLRAFVADQPLQEYENGFRVDWAEVDCIFTGRLFARPKSVTCSAKHVRRLAQYLDMLEIGGVATYGWIETMLYAGLNGDLFTAKDDWLDPDALQPLQFWSRAFLETSPALNEWREDRFPMQEWHEISFDLRFLFGKDVKSTIDKFKRFAATPPGRDRQERLLAQTIFIDMACRIHAGAVLQEGVRLLTEQDS